jgi:hypothetical protein
MGGDSDACYPSHSLTQSIPNCGYRKGASGTDNNFRGKKFGAGEGGGGGDDHHHGRGLRGTSCRRRGCAVEVLCWAVLPQCGFLSAAGEGQNKMERRCRLSLTQPDESEERSG